MLRARLPVDAVQREWIDGSLTKLTELFGPAGDWQTILPTADYFPAGFDGSFSDVRKLVDRVSHWLHIDPVRIDLEVYSDPADDDDGRPPIQSALVSSTVAGDYTPLPDGRGRVGIHRDDLRQPLTLVATIGHELAHHLLSGRGHRVTSLAEGEGLTDLLTTHLGLGIIAANAQRQHRSHRGGGWSVTTLGYLSAQTYGYALARRAVSMGEPDPPWGHHLAPNPRGYLRASLAVLTQR